MMKELTYLVFHLILLPTLALSQVSFSRTEAISDNGAWGLSATEGPSGSAFSFFKSAAGGLAFAERSGGGYALTDVDASAGAVNHATEDETSLVFLNNSPHIFYTHADDNDVLHAYLVNNIWNTEVIDSDAGFPEAVVCGSELCVCYKDTANNDLKLARGSTGTWVKNTVDDSANDVGSFCNLIQHSTTGDLIIAYYDATSKNPKIAEGVNAFALETLTTGGAAEWGYWPHLLEVEDGAVELRASSTKTSDTSVADTFYFYSKKTMGGSWSSPFQSFDSYIAGYPTATIAQDLVFQFIRYLRYSAIFGNTSFISLNQELEDNSSLNSNLGTLGSCMPQIRLVNSWYSAVDRKVRLAYSQNANCVGVPSSAVIIYESDQLPETQPDTPPEDSENSDPNGDSDDESEGSDSNNGNDASDGTDTPADNNGNNEDQGQDSGDNSSGNETPEKTVREELEEVQQSVKSILSSIKSGSDLPETTSIRSLSDRLQSEASSANGKKKRLINKAIKAINRFLSSFEKYTKSGKGKRALRRKAKGASKALGRAKKKL